MSTNGKVTNGELFLLFQPIRRAGKEDLLSPMETLIDADVPVACGMKVVKLAKGIRSEVEIIQSQLDKLIAKHNPGSNTIDAQCENWGRFISEYNELMNMDSDIKFHKVQLPKDTVLKTQHLILLDKYVEIEA